MVSINQKHEMYVEQMHVLDPWFFTGNCRIWWSTVRNMLGHRSKESTGTLALLLLLLEHVRSPS